ncbi:hypothetical protein D0X99_17795 [Algoriphagus lacus]|uniref:Uncharacterized protein n=1 Tax=Algoriphagus lacus TaxID=2056311 RepID=A0A418PMZ6_9BACT|nr:hypothetical protein [Algoriphagus lacus]RIW12947.1 hypothetical protein D0X99_17795 [Algoriphagus lacus]
MTLSTVIIFLQLAFFNEVFQPKLKIPAGQEIQVPLSGENSMEVKIFNSSQYGLDVRVIDRSNGAFVRGFGMVKESTETVLVEPSFLLILSNSSTEDLEVSYSYKETNIEKSEKANLDEVKLTFHNGSLSSIPLIIPGVMNPNLSPMSDSGVTLKMGQKVFFKEKNKQYLLFEVSPTLKNGDVLEIQDLIKERKKELGLR